MVSSIRAKMELKTEQMEKLELRVAEVEAAMTHERATLQRLGALELLLQTEEPEAEEAAAAAESQGRRSTQPDQLVCVRRATGQVRSGALPRCEEEVSQPQVDPRNRFTTLRALGNGPKSLPPGRTTPVQQRFASVPQPESRTWGRSLSPSQP